MRRVREMPEKTRRKPLSRPTALLPECANSCRTASAAPPVSRNRPMRAAETTSRSSAGASADTSSRIGMSAVNAWEARTSARSMPCRPMNERAQRPTNVVSSR